MDLILWRHAEAEEGSDDLLRPLTDKGRIQAQASAAWLQAHLPKQYQIWVSEALRSQQTAAYLSGPTHLVPSLNPNASAENMADLLRQAKADAALVWVGHQPWLGQLCAWLLNGQWSAQAYWSVKKSGFWWFELYFDSAGHPAAKLKAALTPAMLRKC